jgi:hypothetical protein
MLHKGLRITVEKDTWFIIKINDELIKGVSLIGTRIDTIHDVWTFETKEEQLEKYNELNKIE